MTIRIGSTEITPGSGQPYIIAEVGSNWTSFEDCVYSIDQAAKAGANAVKFQAFTHKALFGVPQTKAGYDEKYELPMEWLPRLKNAADQCRVDLLCTAFDPQMIRVIDPHVYAHKVASSDMNYEELLAEVGKMGKPVLVSTGAATETEIGMAVAMLPSVPVVVMYCVAAYPAKSVDLTVIDKLKRFSPNVGFSDHTTDSVYLPYAAAKFHGACVIEKHFTAIKDLTPDSPHSLSPPDFKLMVDRIRGKRTGQIGATPEERDMILRHKRRIVATQAIKKGELFRRGSNFGVYRSLVLDTKGLSPWNAAELHNKTSQRDIEPGDTIAAADFA